MGELQQQLFGCEERQSGHGAKLPEASVLLSDELGTARLCPESCAVNRSMACKPRFF